ncbi:MAG: glycoside hydrolase family 104 protein [Rhodobacteraceae bacterium]|nr:glycoside hydrolase family 104 protein [Paracoccaceae bacterium]
MGLIDRTEGAGGYDTLYGHSQRPGGRFEGVDISKMTLDEVAQFSDPNGEYGQWVKGEVGRVATPMGRGQIVGTTMRGVAKELGLPGSTRFDAATQELMINHLARQSLAGPLSMAGKMDRLRGTWEGLKGVSDEELQAAILEFEGGGGQAASSEPPQPVLVKTSSGAVEPRLYSPLSGPLLQAHNAAAATAYLSDMVMAAERDFSALSTQYPLDPAGFLQAAQGYVEQAVEGAPDAMKPDLRANLERDMQQSYLGMVEEKQADTRKRADNSSAALVKRWGNSLAEALAAGNEEAAAAARSRLDDLLEAREAMPGVAWTRAQSENVILGAYDDARKLETSRLKTYTTELGKKLDGVIAAAENGQRAADEALLDDPAVRALQPEKAREAAAKITLREIAPQFMSMPPEERTAAIAEEKGRTLGSAWETDLLDAMESMDKKAVTALETDPVQYFEDFMPEGQKPPQLPTDMTDPGNFMAALAARKDYALERAAEGYTTVPAFFSKAEIETLSPLFAAGGDPAVKALLAKSFVSAFGASAGAALKEVKADDVTRHVGGLMAAGTSEAVAQKALIGQGMIDEGLVQLPPKAAAVETFSPEIADALGAAGVGVQGGLLKTAKAIYAASARGVDPTSDDANDLMAQAMQEALGYEETRRGATGGVQEVNGIETLLPPGVSPDRVEIGIRNAIDRYSRREADNIQRGDPEIWGGNGVPSYAGQPLDAEIMRDARFVPITGPGGAIMTGMYRIELFGGTDVENEAGDVFIFDMRRLAEGVR